MDDRPVVVLQDIVRTYGAGVLDDPRRCRALLMDFCGEYRGEINVLVMALREGIPQELAAPMSNVPRGLLVARLEQRLRDDYFLPEAAARWAVAACASALDPVPQGGAVPRVFGSRVATTVSLRPWLAADRSWREIGRTPGEVPLPSGVELRLSARVDDADAQVLAGDLGAVGGIDQVDLSYCGITDRGAVAIASVEGISSLDLSRTSVTLAALPDTTVGTQLRAINLRGSVSVEDAGLGRLAQIDGLERLDVSRCHRITDQGVAHLVPLRRLSVLGLSATSITDAGLRELGALHAVRQLDLSGTAVTGTGLRYLADNRVLESLDLSGCVALRPASLSIFRELRELTELSLARCGMIGDRALAHLRPLAGLQQLSLEGLDVTDTGALYLRDLTSLSQLNVAWTKIGDAGVARISDLRDLQTLSLAGTQVTDSGLVHLVRLPLLTYLDLANTGVTDTGLRNLGGLGTLQGLDLEATSIRDAGLVHLGSLGELRRLYLGSTAVTDAGLALLSRVTDLTVVDVALCSRVSRQGIEVLEAAGVAVAS